MRNKLFIGLSILLLSNVKSLLAQTFYYGNNQQLIINESKLSAVFYFNSKTQFNFSDSDSIIQTIEYTSDSLGIITNFKNEWSDNMINLINYFAIDSSMLIGTSFSYLLEDNTKIFPSFNVVLKLKPGYELSDVETLLSDNNLIYLQNHGEVIAARAINPTNTINAANNVNNDSLVMWCHPDFLIKTEFASIPNDVMFPYQYYLHNTALLTLDADIDAPEAWDITTGNGTVTIAIVDMGVSDHEDFKNGTTSRVISGWAYDVIANPNYGNIVYSVEKHGQRVAGIAAATQNNTVGISGVCPNSLILPIRVPYTFVPAQDIADGITWAYQNGADVINCSFGYGCAAFYNNIANSIIDATSLGRNGLGCVVVASAGNGNQNCVNFPANLPNVIAVSALDRTGVLTGYSQNGPQISVAAFGGEPEDIFTTDQMGLGTSGGSTGLNYNHAFGGTSAAAPQVSGVAALLISEDPNLTWQQIQCRIRNTATDIGAFGFDNQYGFGRLDAYYCVALTNLDLIDATIGGFQNYAATDYITSGTGSQILNTANVSLVAGRAVILNPGFNADLNSVFSATINTTTPCGNNGGGPFRFTNYSSPDISKQPSMDNQNLIVISPNPAKYNILVKTLIDETIINRITVKNLMGQILSDYIIETANSYLIDVTNYTPGLYFLTIQTNQGGILKKIIKK